MQTALRSPIPDASLAVFPVNGENSHQGFEGRNPAPHPVREACKFTVLLGLRGQAELNRIGSRCTGKERDAESGLDYFGARYYGSNMGRFMSPDEPFVGQDFSDPQSLNLYSYVQNNPLSNTDPDGRDCVTQTRTSSSTESVSVSTGSCSGNVGDGQSQTYVSGTVTGVQAGADGHSIDIGSTNSDGSTSVTNSSSAPVPNNPGIAFGYNQAGYNQLANASRVVSAVAGAEMSIMAPWAGAAAGCMSGGSRGSCAANMALSILPEIAELKAGATLLKDAAVLGKKGAEILQKAGGAAEATKEFESLSGTEQVLGTTRVKTLSDGSKAVLYNSTGGSGAATIAIQHAGGGVTKIRY
jgi:RHS repeat-associated protein